MTEYIPKVLSYKPHKMVKISNAANGQFAMACNENNDQKTASFLLDKVLQGKNKVILILFLNE